MSKRTNVKRAHRCSEFTPQHVTDNTRVCTDDTGSRITESCQWLLTQVSCLHGIEARAHMMCAIYIASGRP